MELLVIEPEGRFREQVACAVGRARTLGRPVLVSRSHEITPPEDLLVILEHARGDGADTVFWERGAQSLGIAGVGVAWACEASGPDRFREIAAACDALGRDAVIDHASLKNAAPGPLFLGGFSFAPDAAADGPWRGFPAGRLVLPRLLIARRDDGATLTLSTMVDQNSDVYAVCRRLARDVAWLCGVTVAERSGDSAGPSPTRYEATATPARELWKDAVAATIADIRGGRLEKLVLARTCTITSDRELDCSRVVRRLCQAYPSCAAFWFGRPDGSFFGATPESLIRRQGRMIITDAIAGSIARGTSPGSDRMLAHALLESEKDRREHGFVVRAITSSLEPLCDGLDVSPEPQVLQLDNVQHLLTSITGQLAGQHHLLDLVEHLHPTPSVAGYPRAAALAALRARELLDRGWYAGPVGWMDMRGDGELAVALRSALVRGCEASLYAGAGIVAGSDPEAELAETRLKLQPLLSALMEI